MFWTFCLKIRLVVNNKISSDGKEIGPSFGTKKELNKDYLLLINLNSKDQEDKVLRKGSK